jgi:hypothetical protein
MCIFFQFLPHISISMSLKSFSIYIVKFFELFDAVVKLLKAIEHKTFSEVQRAQEILRILHLYILPELVLKRRCGLFQQFPPLVCENLSNK